MSSYPKIELHVHLEATVRPSTLFEIARKNSVALPAQTEEELKALYRFRDFAHFIEVWMMTTNALQEADDFRRIVVDYAAEAASFGCVYIEGIFSPAEPARRGIAWDEVFSGYCEGAAEAKERHGVEVRLTPDITRSFTIAEAEQVAQHAVKYRERGVVGLGLGGLEAEFPPEPFRPVFQHAKAEGLASVPHAGEVAGPASVRGALEALEADRIRHGFRAEEDPGLLGEIAGANIVLDICPISNLRTGVVRSISEHPLPRLVARGVSCSISTDDPAMFDTDLARDYEAACSFGIDPKTFYEAGVQGAMCDDATRERLRAIGDSFDWALRDESAHPE